MRRAGEPPLGPEERRGALLDFADDRRHARRPLQDRRGRRDLRRRHDRDRRGHPPRHRPRGRARRLRRPQPVDRARRPGGDPRRLRARVGHARPQRALDRRRRPRPRRRLARAHARRGGRAARGAPTSTRASARSPTSSAPTGPTPTPRCSPTSTCSPRARSAASSTTRRSPPCAAARSPAPPTTSSPPRSVAERLTARGILWAPDFVANAGGIINISVELEPEGYAPERAEQRVRAVGGTLRTIFDEAEAAGTTPLAAAMALAARRLAQASDPRRAASLGAPPA